MLMLNVTISFGQTVCGGMKITKAEDHSINSCYSFPDFGPPRQLKRHRIAEAAYMDVIKACKKVKRHLSITDPCIIMKDLFFHDIQHIFANV